ncbi:hypothetical protein BC628DRAFT_1418115 [Trametes gibbosa]|nr:hypothetical protein BC628DRAFT_1418115 [Trametes gibbosa]
MSDSSVGWNVWSVVSGAFGILATIFSCLFVWLRTQYPSKKLPALVALWTETDRLLKTAIQLNGGLFSNDNELDELRLNVLTAQVLIDDLSAVVHPDSGFIRAVPDWWNGVTGEIATLYERLNDLRVRLLIRNSASRKLLIPNDFKSEFPELSTNKGPGTSLQSGPPAALSPSLSSSLPQPHDAQKGIIGISNLNMAHKSESFASSVHVQSGGGMPADTLQPHTCTSLDCLPTQRHLNSSDQDLKRLLSLLHDHPLVQVEDASRRRRSELMRRLGRQPHGSRRTHSLGSDIGYSKLRPKHGSRITKKTISRIVRRVYGVDRGLDRASSDSDPDPESLGRHDEDDEYYTHEFAEV